MRKVCAVFDRSNRGDGLGFTSCFCADGSYYVGTTRSSLERRFAEHQDGSFGGYTARRRPARLVYSQQFRRITDAIEAERELKKWRREKKEALIRGDWELLPALSRRNHLVGAAEATVRPSSP
jgi:predicted GIY-YIG superfamily endonuclease